jgi:F-type H+-transporting ATPase subunit gamma
MPTLKALRTRINSVKSTQKITSAMKMVAASKLRRAQSHAEAARPYAERMERMLVSLAVSVAGSPTAPRLLIGTGNEQVHLLIPVTSDRGLAGAFSSNVGRLARRLARQLEAEGKTVKVLPIGRKGRDFLRRELPDKMIEDAAFAARKVYAFADAEAMARRVIEMLAAGEFDVATVVFNRFASVMTQVPTVLQLVPAPVPEQAAPGRVAHAVYEFEPDEETILARLLPQNLAIQIYRTLLESTAGFYGAQMTAMDSATRNAGDMIRRLSLNYNRARQANITNQLIEIISGAEAV